MSGIVVFSPAGRKRKSGDAFARFGTGSTSGRGSIAGWTPCPLCSSSSSDFVPTERSTASGGDGSPSVGDVNARVGRGRRQGRRGGGGGSGDGDGGDAPKSKSVKLFSHGRGLAAHLRAVHTPWNPGKAERKRREARRKRLENERRRHAGPGGRRVERVGGGDSGEADGREHKRAKLEDGRRVAVGDGGGAFSNEEDLRATWDPTPEETDEWNLRVMDIVARVEAEAKKSGTSVSERDASRSGGAEANVTKTSSLLGVGRDRLGKECPSYRESLPPFLKAAACGDFDALRRCVEVGPVNDDDGEEEKESNGGVNNNPSETNREKERIRRIQSLLSVYDRNGSIAEHWAAGGGYVECLSYLLGLRDEIDEHDERVAGKTSAPDHNAPPSADPSANADVIAASDQAVTSTPSAGTTAAKKIRRRRDGKTSLHYASRNGHAPCIDLLLGRIDAPPVDVRSGDGSTPLHMACFGGQYSAARRLVETHGADPNTTNEWGCGAAHWVAMSPGYDGADSVIKLCEYLRSECSVDFAVRQRQGHSPLHKAAARKNGRVVEWLAGRRAGGLAVGDANPCGDGGEIDGRVGDYDTCPVTKPHSVQSAKTGFSDEETKAMGLPDGGGNRPSDIWISVGGDESFGRWMREICDW